MTILILKYFKAMAKYGWYLSNFEAFFKINPLVKFGLRHLSDDSSGGFSSPIDNEA